MHEFDKYYEVKEPGMRAHMPGRRWRKGNKYPKLCRRDKEEELWI